MKADPYKKRVCLYFYRSTATWKIELPEEVADEKEGWHIVRIKLNGPNASGQTYYLSLSGFEIYGKVTGVLDQLKRKYIGICCHLKTD